MKVSIVVGNPKARSRTWDTAHRVATGLGATEVSAYDLVDLGPGLLGWGDPGVSAAVAEVGSSDVAIFASPTFKATYTGLLKLFLDQLPGGTGLAGIVGIPLMLGAGPGHQLAPELHLKPVLVEVGATVPAPSLYLIDSASQPDPVEEEWLARWAPVVRAAVGVHA